jgi:predicted nucleic acid-binding protein
LNPTALVDSNVVVAALVEAHVHHPASLALFANHVPGTCAITAHSYAEAYATLTRRGDHAPFRLSANEAWAALESLAAITSLIGLTPAQTFDTVRDYAQGKGIGARLYDRLIGEAAVMNGLPTLITWNTGHMGGLFPQLTVVTPDAFV